MAGYYETRQMIIDTLMGRPKGTEIQPEDHQTFALQITDYIRSVELVARNVIPLAGFAEANTVPVQPDLGQAVYWAQVNPGETVIFSNFFDVNGDPISVTSDSSHVTLVTLIWDGQHWSGETAPIAVTIVPYSTETLRVNFTQSGNNIVSSSSAAAIKTAFDAGKYVYAVYEGEILTPSKINSAVAVFNSMIENKTMVRYEVDANSNVTYEEITL